MRKTIALGIVGSVSVLAGCMSSTSVGTAPDTAGAATQAAAHAPQQRKAHVGDPITVKSTDTTLRVTLVRVARKTKATDGISHPGAGKRYYAAQLRLVNTGRKTFSDAMDNDATVIDGQGQSFQPDIVESIKAGPMFPDTVNVVPGGKSLGWIVFAVPKRSTITRVQFVADSGFSNGAEWRVP